MLQCPQCKMKPVAAATYNRKLRHYADVYVESFAEAMRQTKRDIGAASKIMYCMDQKKTFWREAF